MSQLQDLILVVSFSSFVFVLFLIYAVYRVIGTVNYLKRKFEQMTEDRDLETDLYEVAQYHNIALTGLNIKKGRSKGDIEIRAFGKASLNSEYREDE